MHKDVTPAEISNTLSEITGYKSEAKYYNLVMPHNYFISVTFGVWKSVKLPGDQTDFKILG